MLVLSRKVGEEIVIAGNVWIRVTAVQGDRVRLGISAPLTVNIQRRELLERIDQQEVPFLTVQ